MQPIYLDYHATTPLDSEVKEAMLIWMGEHYGNPHADNLFGHHAMDVLEQSRAQLAQILGCKRTSIIFTSGATEAANLALFGIASHLKKSGRTQIITTNIEHAAVNMPLAMLAQEGFEIITLPVAADGLVAPTLLEEHINPKVGLVAIMHSHNEIGVIQDMAEIADIAHAAGALLFSDMTQSLGKTPTQLQELPVDMACFSAHKLYGPMGIGALYCKQPSWLEPRNYGGGQEKNLRSGTVAVFLAIGFAKAAEIATTHLKDDMPRITHLRNQLHQGLKDLFPPLITNGSMESRLAGNLHITLPHIAARSVQDAVSEIQFSMSSACAASSGKVSHVMRALGYQQTGNEAHLRFCVGRPTTQTQIEQTITLFRERLSG